MRDRDLLRLLQENGWREVRINGSHHVLVKGDKELSIPVHGKDVKPGLLNRVMKVAGLK